jgi:hypothetical protein
MTTPPKPPSRFRAIVTTTGPIFLDTKTGKFLDAKGKVLVPDQRVLVPDQPPKPKPKRKRGKSSPSTRKAWALNKLRELYGDEKATQKVLSGYLKKFAKNIDPVRDRDNIRRNIDRWRVIVEEEIAAEEAAARNPDK